MRSSTITIGLRGCGAPLTEATATGMPRGRWSTCPNRSRCRHEHRRMSVVAPACGAQTRAAFPDWVTAPVQYGKRIGGFVLYLLHDQLLPEKRLAALMADLFGVPLATAPSPGSARTAPNAS